MSRYIVQGRRFNRRLHAVTFAQRLSFEQDITVEVFAETKDVSGKIHRNWMCRMHPPGVQRTIIPDRVYPKTMQVVG